MSTSTGGGKATNAGVEFQQRVAAFFLTSMWLRFDVAEFVGPAGPLIIEEVAFETKDEIDDIRLTCRNGVRLFLQVKRKVSLSETVDSEFGGAISQFVRQSLLRQSGQQEYLLVTSSDSSRKVTNDLKRITNAVRESPDQYATVPFNASETDTLSRLRALFDRIILEETGHVANVDDFRDFALHVYVECLDVSAGQPLEKASLLFLATKVSISTTLLWSLLIANSLTYASTRAVVGVGIIDGLLNPFTVPLDQPDSGRDESLGRLVFSEQGHWMAGKEVVLIDSLAPEFDFMIVEMARFAEDGTCRFQFKDGFIHVPKWESPQRVYCRSATSLGVERFLERNESQFKQGKIAIVASNFVSDPNESPAALAHGQLCEKKLAARNRPMDCIHCGSIVNEAKAELLEVDEEGLGHVVGLCHLQCIRATDRVVGVCEVRGEMIQPFLARFDVRLWAQKIRNGQFGLRSALEEMEKRGIPVRLVHNVENADREQYSYCVNVRLSDGTTRYVTARAKIDRMSKAEAEYKAGQMNEWFRRQKAANDPLCYTSSKFTFGVYSLVLATKDADEECIECVSAEVARYSAVAEEQYGKGNEWYAPVCYLIDEESERTVTMGGVVLLLSNPLGVAAYLDNWKKSGLELGNCLLQLIDDDNAFDRFVSRCESDGLGVIIDPLCDANGNLIKGLIVESMDSAQAKLRLAESSDQDRDS